MYTHGSYFKTDSFIKTLRKQNGIHTVNVGRGLDIAFVFMKVIRQFFVLSSNKEMSTSSFHTLLDRPNLFT